MAEKLRAALGRFREENGLIVEEEERSLWLATLGTLIIPLPNFRWRREAIAVHDAHHLITGLPFSLEGELCVAAWELGVNCYSDLQARMLCRCMALLGLFVAPRETIAAYRAGKEGREAYALLACNRRLLDLDVDTARSALVAP